MSRPVLQYIFDPLCIWSYGFSPVLTRLIERFGGRLDFEAICGGLAIGDHALPVKDGFPELKQEISQVEKITGTRFGDNFKLLLEEGSYMFNSFPPSKAVNTIGELNQDQSLQFGIRIQHSLFMEGDNLNEIETYLSLAEGFNINRDEFETLYNSEMIAKKTNQQFEWCRRHDTLRFPTLLMRLNDDTGTISKGYRTYESLESHLHHLLNNIERLQD
jgi:putative protein-disulfide isomerase